MRKCRRFLLGRTELIPSGHQTWLAGKSTIAEFPMKIFIHMGFLIAMFDDTEGTLWGSPCSAKEGLACVHYAQNSFETTFRWNYLISHVDESMPTILQGWTPMNPSYFVVKTCENHWYLTGSHRQQLCIQGCSGSWGARGSAPSFSRVFNTGSTLNSLPWWEQTSKNINFFFLIILNLPKNRKTKTCVWRKCKEPCC
jgi:hypothetical protein